MKKLVAVLAVLALLLPALALAAGQEPDFATTLKAATRGDAKAQALLGKMFADGVGTPKDDFKAVYWWTKAASQGHRLAQYSLGLIYANGRGVEKDDTKAAQWFEKSAAQGYANAQYNLGVMYLNGRGVARNPQKGCDLMGTAAARIFDERGDKTAMVEYINVCKSLNPWKRR